MRRIDGKPKENFQGILGEILKPNSIKLQEGHLMIGSISSPTRFGRKGLRIHDGTAMLISNQKDWWSVRI